jgi:hypothetical protein
VPREHPWSGGAAPGRLRYNHDVVSSARPAATPRTGVAPVALVTPVAPGPPFAPPINVLARRALLACCALAAPAARTTPSSASTTSSAALSLWLEQDTNPRRLATDALDDDEAPVAVVPDGLVRAAVAAAVDHDAPRLRLHVDGAAGGKLFFTAATERMAVGTLRAAAARSLDLQTTALLTASTKVRQQVSGARSYAALRSDLAVERRWSLDALHAPGSDGVVAAVRGGVAGVAFEAFDAPLFSSAGGALVAQGSLRRGRERLDIVVDASLRGFPSSPKTPGSADPDRRVDAPLLVAVSATSARPLFVQATALGLRNQTNAPGEAFSRLRVQLALGARLPALVTTTLQLAGQWTRYDDGVSLGQRYFLVADDETQNLVQASLSRPLWGGLALDAHVGAFGNELANNGARFARMTAGLGLRAALW